MENKINPAGIPIKLLIGADPIRKKAEDMAKPEAIDEYHNGEAHDKGPKVSEETVQRLIPDAEKVLENKLKEILKKIETQETDPKIQKIANELANDESIKKYHDGNYHPEGIKGLIPDTKEFLREKTGEAIKTIKELSAKGNELTPKEEITLKCHQNYLKELALINE